MASAGIKSRCIHVRNVGNVTRKDILFHKEKSCRGCDYKGDNKWICLKEGCFYVGCGPKHQDHGGKHSAEANHELQLNVKNSRIWCNVCDCEVYPSNNIPLWEDGDRLLLDRKTSKSYSLVQQPSCSLAAVVEADKKRQSVVPYPSLDKISVADESSKSTNVPVPVHSSSAKLEAKKSAENLSNFFITPKIFAAGRLYRDREHPTAVPDYPAEDLKDYQAPGLVGLRNLGNTCYMNAALQALSNCPPLTEYMLNCRLPADPKYRTLALVYQKLTSDLWDDKRRPAYLVPYEILQAVRSLYPWFRGYQQQDAQEFLRCFLDALHEDIKQPVYEWECQEDDELLKRGRVSSEKESTSAANSSPDDEYFRTCDSGWSSDRESFKSRSSKLRRRAVKSECESLVKTDSSEFSEAQSEFANSNNNSDLVSNSGPIRRTGKRRTTIRYSPERVPKKKPVRFRSIVSDVFDGRLLSAVQCLTCNTVSETRETFQDLSLSIPTREQLEMLKNSRRLISNPSPNSSPFSSASSASSGWLAWTYSWLKNWACGPTISLEDCLAAFFSADDLKGDDMYSCDRCKKLRNGVKYCSLLRLPEVLCIHLKRFRHEMVYSSKISTYISFPIENLNLNNFVDKNSKDEVRSYDLVAVICHRGGVDGGHYTAYCLNPINFRWYEFDDQYATEVDVATVQNCEAYVLFYRKCSDKIDRLRQEVVKSMETKQPSLMKFYISREWIHRFNTFAEPGSITNFDFLCPHGWIAPAKAEYLSELNAEVSEKVWHTLYKHFGGGPVCCQLRHCFECQQYRQRLMIRRRAEYAAFTKLQKEIRFSVAPDLIYGLSVKWYRKWEDFVLDKEEEPPGPVHNKDIVAKRNDKNDAIRISPGAHFVQITRDMWEFFHSNYGGGPEILLTPYPVAKSKSEDKLNNNVVVAKQNDEIITTEEEEVSPSKNVEEENENNKEEIGEGDVEMSEN